nr:hypothetical protein [Tanacetum cinerariifolium]
MMFFLVLFFASSHFIHGSCGTIICEDLTKDNCSFAISSYGKRCVLEDYEGKKGMVEYQCRTSEVMVEIMSGYIETDECVRACGVNRNATGISSDALLDKNSIVTLCSPPCYQRCPNIVDLHFNLAVGEGVSLPDLCEQQRNHPDCAMIELLSSSFVADGPFGEENNVVSTYAVTETMGLRRSRDDEATPNGNPLRPACEVQPKKNVSIQEDNMNDFMQSHNENDVRFTPTNGWDDDGIDTMNEAASSLQKQSFDKVTRVLVWVKLHKVPVVTYSEDGLSLIATQIRNPIMLDAFTSAMCVEAWGRIGFARALIEVSADKELKQEVIMAVPNVDNEGASHTLEKTRVEYEWKPHICLDCHVFGHSVEQCSKHVPEKVTPAIEVDNDGFILFTKRKSKWKSVLNEITSIVDHSNGTREAGIGGASDLKDNKNNKDSDSEFEEVGVNRALKQSEVRQVVIKNQLSICVILESYVNLSSLFKICSWVFRCWEWNLNGGLCSHGCRIIVGWNVDIFHVMVLAQSTQDLYVKNIHNASNKTIFCSFIYDTYSGSSFMTSAMCDFKDCVTDIEVIDVTSSRIHYTWNQKPKGGGGVLKKLDRIMANMKFINTFPGDGHNMFKVVSKLKILKKTLRKLLHDQGNIHERVNKLRLELDTVQKTLDSNPADPILREKACAYVQAFNETKLDEERFLKQKDKMEWLDAGDSNSAYFHKSIKSRNQRSRIELILNTNNEEVMGPLFQAISVDMAANIVRDVTNHEIKAFMFDIGDDKVSGPDGKIITNRIIGGIKEVVSDSQSAFIPSRRISDNIIITQELVHNYHRNKDPHREERLEARQSSFPIFIYIDLFIFARGDVESSRVIMESLEEFKLTSRLVPSIPKSTAYFYNVLHHTKASILSIMPFSEGELPVKYYGVPFISSGLLNWDYKIPVEKSWLLKSPDICLIPIPTLDVSQADLRQWRDRNGTLSLFLLLRLGTPLGLVEISALKAHFFSLQRYSYGISRKISIEFGLRIGRSKRELYSFFLALVFPIGFSPGSHRVGHEVFGWFHSLSHFDQIRCFFRTLRFFQLLGNPGLNIADDCEMNAESEIPLVKRSGLSRAVKRPV